MYSVYIYIYAQSVKFPSIPLHIQRMALRRHNDKVGRRSYDLGPTTLERVSSVRTLPHRIQSCGTDQTRHTHIHLHVHAHIHIYIYNYNYNYIYNYIYTYIYIYILRVAELTGNQPRCLFLCMFCQTNKNNKNPQTTGPALKSLHSGHFVVYIHMCI
jgi:hypothetical protein